MMYVCNQIYLFLLRNHTSSKIKRPMKQRRLLYLKEYYLTMECNLFEAFVWLDSKKRRTGVSLANLIFFIISFRRIIFQFRLFVLPPYFLPLHWLIDRKGEKKKFPKQTFKKIFFFVSKSKIHNMRIFYRIQCLYSKRLRFLYDCDHILILIMLISWRIRMISSYIFLFIWIFK